jgi:Ca2+-binding EF-hand superfamily protein
VLFSVTQITHISCFSACFPKHTADESNFSNRFRDGDFEANTDKNIPSKRKKKRPSVNELFDLIDIDGDGYLIRAEVVAAAGKLGMTEDEAATLFHDLDKDGSGTLTRQELSVLSKMAQYFKMPTFGFSSSTADSSNDIAKKEKPLPKKKRAKRPSVNELFDLIDIDDDGTLIRSEVVAAADKIGMTEDEAALLFHDLDKDGSGTLTRQELSVMSKVAHSLFGQLSALPSFTTRRLRSSASASASHGVSLAHRHSTAVRHLVADRSLTAAAKLARLADMRCVERFSHSARRCLSAWGSGGTSPAYQRPQLMAVRNVPVLPFPH